MDLVWSNTTPAQNPFKNCIACGSLPKDGAQQVLARKTVWSKPMGSSKVALVLPVTPGSPRGIAVVLSPLINNTLQVADLSAASLLQAFTFPSHLTKNYHGCERVASLELLTCM